MDTIIYKFVHRFSPAELKKNPTRHTRNPIVGVVCASKKDNGKVGIGWSRCNRLAGDTFNKNTGLKIALGRAEKGTSRDEPPFTMLPEIEIMQNRAKDFFVGCEVEHINSML